MRERRHTGIAADRADAGYAELCLHLEPIRPERRIMAADPLPTGIVGGLIGWVGVNDRITESVTGARLASAGAAGTGAALLPHRKGTATQLVAMAGAPS
jgi:hypothetical protein